MYEWLANCIIDGYDGMGEKLTYSRAIQSAVKKFKLEEETVKSKVNQILLLKGREDLIEE